MPAVEPDFPFPMQLPAHRTLKEIEQMGYRDKVSLQQELMESYVGTYIDSRPGINTNIEWRICQSGWSEQQVRCHAPWAPRL
jgi:hypothetical protein